MTATLYSNRPTDRVGALRPPGLGSNLASDEVVNFAIRRTVAALLVVILLAICAISASAMIGAISGVGGRPAAASDSASGAAGAPIPRVHVAEAGDTLWSIANRYRGGVDQDRFVDALIDVNGGTLIQVGQAVRLP